MQASFTSTKALHLLLRTTKIAEAFNAYPDDWSRAVVDCNNGLGRVDIYDEENVLIFTGFTL